MYMNVCNGDNAPNESTITDCAICMFTRICQLILDSFIFHSETFVPPIKIQPEGLPWPTSIDPDVKPLKDGVAKPAKIIMLGYLRGGTTFIGQVLGVRAGTFYLYEPLFELGSFVYFKTGEMCGMTQNSCG